MISASIACLGGGNMGRALLAALLRAGVAPAQLKVGDPNLETRKQLRDTLGLASLADNAEAVRGAQLVILAVKPQDAAATLKPLVKLLGEKKPVLLSVAAGLRCADLATLCGGCPVVRAMPNRPALVGAGATGLYAPSGVSTAARELAAKVMACAGSVVWIEKESLMDAVTAVSGSGPAYFFLLAEALAEAGQAEGLSAAAARQLAVATLHGAGLLAQQSDGDLARLRAEVTSKGGTTAAALQVLDGGQGLRPLLRAAVRAATARGAELAQTASATAPHPESKLEK
jgi:pyrroline-5-carboxylate reductase